MSQHDFNIANQGFPATRADINNAFQAIASNSSGATAPSTTYANMWWYDTTNNKMYLRNEADSAWIEVATIDQTNNEWQITSGVIEAVDGDGIVLKTDDGITRMTLDDSGNLLIGKGATGISTAGHSYRADGTWEVRKDQATANSGSTGYLSRGTTDGNILAFYKDTSSVGSIGVSSSDNFYVGGTASNHGGILFNDTGGSQPAIQPCSVAGTLADASVNLGSSGNRFENLYLSGGVYVGGTTSSNHLDDYEQGSFTPAIFGTTTGGTGTYSIQRGGYIKIGALVYAQVYIGWTAHTGTGGMRLSGLPFTSENTNPHGYGAPNMSYASGLSFNYNQLGGYVAGASTTVVFNTFESANLTQVTMDGSVAELLFNLHYIAE